MVIGFGTKDYSKHAWSSRLAAPSIKIDLIVQCRDLPKKDLLSQADSFCVLWQVPNGYARKVTNGVPSKLPWAQEIEKGKTEVARGAVHPTFNSKFRLEFTFHEEQTYVIRVYNEDLRYSTDLKEHDYLGGCVFSLGQLMGTKGCSLAKRLERGKAYMIVTAEEIDETREVLEFRFSCQDLVKEQHIIDQSRVLDKSNPYFRVEKLNPEDQSWEVVWKSERIKDSLNPTWKESRLPLQLLYNDELKDVKDSLKISIWDYDKHSTSHDMIGYVLTSVGDLISNAKEETVPVLKVLREKRKLFGGSKNKTVGLLKVLKATVILVPSMLKYFSGGCSLDLIVGIDCSLANGEMGDEKSLHYSASNWLNDYQAGIERLGTIVENFARGKNSSLWGFGAEIKGKYTEMHLMAERLSLGRELLQMYNKCVVEDSHFNVGEKARLRPLLRAATFQTIRESKRRQCYAILCIFTAGNIDDLQESIDLICSAAEDAPLSIVIIGVGNKDFSSIQKLTGGETGGETGGMRDSRGIPIAREIVRFVSFKQFGGNAKEVIAEALKEVPEQFVTYFVNSGTKPLPPVPAPDFAAIAAAAYARNTQKSKNGHKKKGGKSPKTSEDRKR